MMDGSLGVQSTPGSGSCFTLELPFVRLAAAAAVAPCNAPALNVPAPQPASRYQGKVLCIEDNLQSLALIETLLQRRPGIRLLSSMQGQMGLDLARQHAPQMILLDVSLPDLPGLEVLQRLRASSATADTPILMITADASEPTRRALLDAGATAILTKPIHIPVFFAHLDACLPELP